MFQVSADNAGKNHVISFKVNWHFSYIIAIVCLKEYSFALLYFFMFDLCFNELI